MNKFKLRWLLVVVIILGALVLLLWAFSPLYLHHLKNTGIEKECVTGYVTIQGPYGNRLVLGDMELCGVNLEFGGLKGPSKIYDSGDPL